MVHFIKGDIIGFDTETTGLDLWHGHAPFGFSFFNLEGDSAYFEWDVDPFTRAVSPNIEQWGMMKALLEDEKITKVGHNMKFDVRAMEEGWNIRLRGPGGRVADGGTVHDTFIMAHCCNSLEMSFGLKQLCDKYGMMDTTDQSSLKKIVQRCRRKAKKLGWKLGEEEKEQPDKPAKKKAVCEMDYWMPRMMRKLHPDLISGEDAECCATYAVKDAERTIALYMMYSELLEEYGIKEIYNFEMRLWPIIYNMETRGLCVNQNTLKDAQDNALARIREFKPQLDRQAWPGFNADSPADVRRLAKKLGIKFSPEMLTPTGLPAVGREFLQSQLDNPVIHMLAKYRTSVKAFVSFFGNYKRQMSPCPIAKGFNAIHANFQQVGPATGRLSCRNPNLQNVMDPTVSFSIDPMHVRHIFIPRPGYRWLCVDYSNMEVRVFADIAQEPVMLAAIREGRDIHSGVANQIWGGENNPIGIRQAIRALQLDGTGIGTAPEVTVLWKEWGISNPLKLSDNNRNRFAADWLASFNWDIVKAQDSVKRRYARNIGKMVTFLKIYGGGLPGARKLLKDEHGNRLPDENIIEILHHYDSSMPRIQEYSRELIQQAKTDNYIMTKWGRRLAIDPYFAYRAVNYIVQGSSADLMKFSMIRCNDYFKEQDYEAHVVLTVHDELISEVRESSMTHRLINGVCDIMSNAEGFLDIDMPVEPKIVVQDWSKKLAIRKAA